MADRVSPNRGTALMDGARELLRFLLEALLSSLVLQVAVDTRSFLVRMGVAVTATGLEARSIAIAIKLQRFTHHKLQQSNQLLYKISDC